MPSASATLSFFRCKEVGDAWWLSDDYAIQCYTKQWASVVIFAVAGILLYIIGIPFTILYFLHNARNQNVDAIVNAMDSDETLLMKLLNEAKADSKLDGKIWTKPLNRDDEVERLRAYLQTKNMRLLQNRQRYGFLYKFYSEGLWWFEASELTRRLAVSCVLFFFEPGRPIQIVLALIVCIGYLMQMTYLLPYRGDNNNELAILCQAQLCLSLVCGIMIQLRVPVSDAVYSMHEEHDIITGIVAMSHLATCSFGIYALIREGILSRQHWYEEQERVKRQMMMSRSAIRRTMRMTPQPGSAASVVDLSSDEDVEAATGAVGDHDSGSASEGEEQTDGEEEVVLLRALSHEQEEFIRIIFEDCDDNGSGTIEIDELHEIALRLGEPLSGEELEKIMSLLDTSGGGSVEWSVFMPGWRKMLPGRGRSGSVISLGSRV
jgi:hypothetical protein